MKGDITLLTEKVVLTVENNIYIAVKTIPIPRFLPIPPRTLRLDIVTPKSVMIKAPKGEAQRLWYSTSNAFTLPEPRARVKLYACYTKTAVEDAQYFRGKKGEFNEENTVQILGGGEGYTWYTMRVIYDFKTNRLLAAWIPDTQIGDEGLQIDADIMIIREHQEEATCINLTEHTNSKLTDVKTVYGVMRFNRWVLNNRANPDDLDIDHCSTVKNNNRQYRRKRTYKYLKAK